MLFVSGASSAVTLLSLLFSLAFPAYCLVINNDASTSIPTNTQHAITATPIASPLSSSTPILIQQSSTHDSTSSSGTQTVASGVPSQSAKTEPISGEGPVNGDPKGNSSGPIGPSDPTSSTVLLGASHLESPAQPTGKPESGPVGGEPVAEPSLTLTAGCRYCDVPGVLTAASALVPPAQSTAQSENAPKLDKPETPAKPSSEPSTGGSAPSVSQVASNSPSNGGDQPSSSPSSNSPSTPQAGGDGSSNSQEQSLAQPDTQSQSSSSPQVDSTTGSQGGDQTTGTSQGQSSAQPATENQSSSGSQVESSGGSQTENQGAGVSNGGSSGQPVSQSQSSTSQGDVSTSAQTQSQDQTSQVQSSNGVNAETQSQGNSQEASPNQSTGEGQTTSVTENGSPSDYSTDSNTVAGSSSPDHIGFEPVNVATPQFTVGGEVVTANSASQYVCHGQTLVPGGPAVTIAGSPISLAPSATQVVVGGQTVGLQRAEIMGLPTFTVQGQVLTANSASQYVFDGQTITPGAPAVTISGIPISVPAVPKTTGLPSFTIEGQIITANSASRYVFDGQIITPGAPAVTISGTPISISLIPLQTKSPQGVFDAGTTAYPYSINSKGDVVLASQTLVPGGTPVTVGEVTVSEAPDGSDVIIVSGGTTRTQALGQLTMPTGISNIPQNSTFVALHGLNSSTTAVSGTASGPITSVTSAFLSGSASATLPVVNPMNGGKSLTSGAGRMVGDIGRNQSLYIMAAMLGACISVY